MKTPRIEVGKIRREQIVEAAVAIIAEEGLQNLSLSAIEARTGMSRGQLTYYFKAKEDILLAVFDRLLCMMHQRARGEQPPCMVVDKVGWERVKAFLTMFLLNPPPMPEFHSLQYTFLSQITHREDFRQRLASLYAEWRQHMSADIALDLRDRSISARTMATFVQAVLHGLAMQRAADPDAYDKHEMLKLLLQLLEGTMHPRRKSRRAAHASANGKTAARNGHARRGRVLRTANPER